MRLTFIISLFFVSCASTSKIDTQIHEAAVESVKQDIDISIDCNTQTDSTKCNQTIAKIKETLDRGVEITKEKDSVIETLTTENKSLESKASKWDRLIFSLWTLSISIIVLLIGAALWRYRLTILRLAGVPVPPWMT